MNLSLAILSTHGGKCLWVKIKKGLPRNGLLSHSLAAVVPSALHCFTSRFGMGLGGPSALKSRNKSLFFTKEKNKCNEAGNSFSLERSNRQCFLRSCLPTVPD